MKITTIPKKLKQILSKNKLNKLAKSIGFTKRERNITAFQLVTALICTLGDKHTDYLSDILRCFNRLTNQNVKYKPFHNQLSKPALAELMKVIASKVFSLWINDVLNYKKGHFSQFNKVYIQDGSSFAVKDTLKNVWPGRFTKISPAAIELHATINLQTGSFEQAIITPDTFSERGEMPNVKELKGNLFLADRGYYSGEFIVNLDKAGGHYVLRAKGLKRVTITSATRADGKSLMKKKAIELSKLQARLPKRQAVDMNVEIKGEVVRLIAFWSLKEKRHTYLITNLKRDEFSISDIDAIYRMRWQVELIFKECKSHNSLHGFNTEKASIQESLIWASLISVTLKRFISGCVERIFKVEMSTMLVSKTTVSWWYDVLEAIVQQRRKALIIRITETCYFLKENAKRAHPKRDRDSGILQYALEPAFYAEIS
ncbi:MAG: transposase [Gammaproteobacteria bacterium CG22_combo_CG10-13_8_21_14_all_40_8]|nr:MAG: transposase [Gammaproteobacteria bacterium CG22_combo_CG10-13_8_21_14_all_40_8]